MAHDKIKAFSDATAAPMTLEQQRRLGRGLLRRKPVQPAIKIFGYTQIMAMVKTRINCGGKLEVPAPPCILPECDGPLIVKQFDFQLLTG